MGWDSIRGQEEAVDYLRGSIRKGKVVNGYLFQGPEGVGKELTAKVFAQALNCQRSRTDPCGRCPACRQIDKGSSPDVCFVYPVKKSGSISIDQIRNLQKKAYLKSSPDSWKVLAVNEAEMMTASAQNSLLKTLEEPPARTVFILVTARPEQLLPTIRSRCQAVRFRPWSLELMTPFLQAEAGLDAAQARVLHSLSRGRPGGALRLAEEGMLEARLKILKPFSRGRRLTARQTAEQAKSWVAFLDKKGKELASRLQSELKAWGKELAPAQRKALEDRSAARVGAGEREDLEFVFELIFSWFRDLYVYRQTGSEAQVINRDLLEEVAQASGQWTESRLRRALEWTETCRSAARMASGRSVRRMVFESLLIRTGFWRPETREG